MIAIIDYELGNLRSVSNAFEKLGVKAEVTSSPEKLQAAQAIVLPGVGAFSKGMEYLQQLNILPTVSRMIAQGKPFLGICLGLQLLFNESEEHGDFKGLGFIEGTVEKFKSKVKLPHMGWNQIKFKDTKLINQKQSLFSDITEDDYFYFVHSYYVVPKNRSIVLGKTYYGEEFPALVVKDNIVGVQFHPEKSGEAGSRFLQNFINTYLEEK